MLRLLQTDVKLKLKLGIIIESNYDVILKITALDDSLFTLYCVIYIPTDSTVVRVFAFRTGDRISIPCRVIPKTIKMVIVPLCQVLLGKYSPLFFK